MSIHLEIVIKPDLLISMNFHEQEFSVIQMELSNNKQSDVISQD